MAKSILAQRGDAFELQAHTSVYDRLIPDQERYFSGLVATALDIPIHYLVADDYPLFAPAILIGARRSHFTCIHWPQWRRISGRKWPHKVASL